MSEPRFYVYELIDPRDGSVFYVGKGQAKRYLAHLKEAARGVRSRKCDRIREIMADGNECYDHRLASMHYSEQEAYDAEADLIVSYGLDSLTNVLPGGGNAYRAYKRAKARCSQRQALAYVRNNGEKIAVMSALSEHGFKFMLGDVDISVAVKAAISSLRNMVGDEFFSINVPKAVVSAV